MWPPGSRRRLGRLAASGLVLVATVVLGPPADVLPAWLGSLGSPAAGAQIPCPDVPGIKQACQVSTALPDGAINAVGGVAGAGVAAGARAVLDGMTHWVVAGASELVSLLGSWIDGSTRPEVASGWFTQSYTAMVKVGMAFVLPMLLLATIGAVARQDLGGLGRAVVVQLPLACLGMVGATAVVDLLVSVTDNFSTYVGSAIGDHGERFGQGLTKALTIVDGSPGLGFAVFLIALVLALLALVLWAELVLRQAAVLVTTLFLPLGFAGMVWAPAGRWLRRLGEVIFALVLSKFVITAILAAGAAALDSASEGFGQVIVGVAIVALAAFAPYAIFRFVPIAELGAIAALEGMRSRPARAATSSPLAYATTSVLRSKMARPSGGGGGSGNESGGAGPGSSGGGASDGGSKGGGSSGGGRSRSAAVAALAGAAAGSGRARSAGSAETAEGGSGAAAATARSRPVGGAGNGAGASGGPTSTTAPGAEPSPVPQPNAGVGDQTRRRPPPGPTP